MRSKLILFIFLLSSFAGCNSPKAKSYCVRLVVSKQPFDFESPWLQLNETVEIYYGTVVDRNTLLTTAEAVRDNVLIEAQPFGSAEKIPVEVDWVDYEANLAVIKINDKLKEYSLTALPIAQRKPDKPSLIKAKNEQETTDLGLKFLKAEVRQSETSQLNYTQLIFESGQKGHGSAEPIVDDGSLVGLVTSQNDSSLVAIPSTIIQHFLRDGRSEKDYRGFPRLGVYSSPLIDPAKIKKLGVDKDTEGVYVHRVVEGGQATGKLEVNDVVTEINGYAVDKAGMISHPVWGKLHFSAALDDLYAGDELELEVIRNKDDTSIEIPLKRFDSNRGQLHFINSPGEKSFRLVGGLIVQELSVGFLKQFGNEWNTNAPLNLLYLYENNMEFGYTDQRVVFLNKVLADEGNRGYEEMRYVLIDKVNGQEVHSLADFDAALAKPVSAGDSTYMRIQFKEAVGEIVLDQKNIAGIDARVRENYNLP